MQQTFWPNKLITLVTCALVFATSSITSAAPKYIIFDLPQTVLKPDETAFFNDVIGWGSGILYTVSGNNPFELEKLVFDTLETMGQQTVPPALLARSHKERVLPQIFCDLLTNTVPYQEAIKRAKKQVKELNNKQSFYTSRRQRKLVMEIIKAIFTPQELAKHTAVIKEGADLVKACAARCGNQSLAIIANWDLISLRLLIAAEHTHDVMRYFNPHHVFVSGSMKQLLPQPACFEMALRQLNVTPQECVYVSGIRRHAEAAKAFGLKTVFIANGNYSKAREELTALGAL